jgi:hypothetical protein
MALSALRAQKKKDKMKGTEKYICIYIKWASGPCENANSARTHL